MDPAHGAVSTRMEFDCHVVAFSVNGVHVVAGLRKLFIEALLAVVVVGVEGVLEFFEGDVKFLGKLFQRLGDDELIVFFVQCIFDGAVDVPGKSFRFHQTDVREPVSFVDLRDGVIHDGPAEFARLDGDGVAGEGRVAAGALVHEAVAVAIDEEVPLTEQHVEGHEVQLVRHVVDHLDIGTEFFRSCLPHHLQSIAHDAGDHEGDDVLAEVQAQFFFHHFGVGPEAAGADDDGFGRSLDLLPVFVLCLDAGDTAVLRLDEVIDRSLQKDLDAEFQRPLVHLLHHGRGTARPDGAALRLDDVPGRFRVP